MKKSIQIIAIAAMMALLASLAVGCTSAGTNSDSGNDPEENTSQSGSGSDSDAAETKESVAEVISVNGADLEVRFYLADSDADSIEDYTAVDLTEYAAAEETETLTVAEDAEIFTVSSGELADAALEDVTAGTYLAVTYAGETARKIVILSISQPTMLVAQVTGISEDGLLSLTRCKAKDDAGEGSVTDYANIDATRYEATGETDEYTVADGVLVSVAEDGVLTEATADEIAVGDLLVFYSTEDGQTAIAVYHPQPESSGGSEA